MSEKVENRNRAVLEAGVALAEKMGMAAVTRSSVAIEAGVSVGTVSNAFGTMGGLRDAVMAACVDREILLVVAQGLAEGHPAATSAPQDLKARALARITNAA